MTYLYDNRHQVSRDDNQNTETNPIYVEDAKTEYTNKNRLKVSQIETRWFSTFNGHDDASQWDTQTAAGATALLDANGDWVNLTVTTTAGSKVIRQTKNVFGYIPGRGATQSFAIKNPTPVAGLRTRYGVFDENNGFFFEYNGTDRNIVIRSDASGSPVDITIPRANWDDPMDGTGPSGVDLDIANIQQYNINYEWYGAGFIEFSVVLHDRRVPMHRYIVANLQPIPYCSTVFLPMRIEVENTGSLAANATMIQLSASHHKEGDSTTLGAPFSAATSITGKTMAAANTYYPMLSIRLKSTQLNGFVVPTYFQAATSDSSFIQYRVVRNATLTGASWVSAGASSAVEKDVSATAATGGEIIVEGFIPSGTNPGIIHFNGNGQYTIGRENLGTTSQIYTLELACIATNKTGYGAFGWVEQH